MSQSTAAVAVAATNANEALGLTNAEIENLSQQICNICGKSFKASMIVIYNSRVIPDLKIPHILTLDL